MKESSQAAAGTIQAVEEDGVSSITLDLEERTHATEPDILSLGNNRLMLVYGAAGVASARYSKDGGLTWEPRITLKTVTGESFPTLGTNSIKRLQSGRLMLLHRDEPREERDRVATRFRISEDEGLTWSDGNYVNPPWEVFAVHNGQASVLQNGRILLPGMTWFMMQEMYETDWSKGGWDYMMCFSHVRYSDDEGESWERGISQLNASVEQGRRGLFPFEEPSVAEFSNGELFMAARTNLGRLFDSQSTDGGVNWFRPEPMNLASSYAPPAVERIPGTDELLMVWSQASPWEQRNGLRRHRLSMAISEDRGKSWSHFRNLESLDNKTRIEPPELSEATDCEGPFSQPSDKRAYPRAPGPLRCAYPAATFLNNSVAVAYDHMIVDEQGNRLGLTAKVKVVPLDWIRAASP